VQEESRVFGGNYRISDVWAHLVVVHRDTVLVVESGHNHRFAVFGGVKVGGLGGVYWLDVVG
jgi:hypothetical protein